MTKSVRVENADTSTFGVVVEVWDKGYPAGEPDKLASSTELNYPCRLDTFGITSTRYLVIKETPPKA